MKSVSRMMWLGCFVGMSVAAVGCGAKDGEKSEASASAAASSPPPVEKSASAATAAKSAETTADAAPPAGSVNPKVLLEDEKGESSSIIDVRIPDDTKDAPLLGGGGGAITAPARTPVTWLSAGPLVIPNPGWTKNEDDKAMALMAPDKLAAIVFQPYTTTEDGTGKVDALVRFLKLKDAKWKKPQSVRIGPDKLPALFGSGRATNAKGKTAKLFYAAVKSGGQLNLLAIGLANEDTPADELELGLRIVDSIKRKP